MELGICNNAEFLRQFLGESPLTATLGFSPIGIWPIMPPYEHKSLIAMASVYAELRYAHTEIPNAPLKKAMIIGETLSPRIPIAKRQTEAVARVNLVEYMKYGLLHDIPSLLGDFTPHMYVEYLQRPEVNAHYGLENLPEAYPLNEAAIAGLDLIASMGLCYFFAVNLRVGARTQAIDIIAHAYSALAKRGQATDEFCTKVRTSIQDELGVTINLTTSVINAVYKGYMTGVNETNAAEVFRALDALVPEIALRLKLTLTQAANSGLTVYIMIGRAIRKYRDFPWGRVNTLTGGEVLAWNGAQAIIGQNAYYGFKRDLEAARSTLYKSLGWVARELLVRINGERTLLRYAGISGNVKNKAALERLLNEYIGAYEAIEGAETEAERRCLLEENVLTLNPLFA